MTDVAKKSDAVMHNDVLSGNSMQITESLVPLNFTKKKLGYTYFICKQAPGANSQVLAAHSVHVDTTQANL
jgi:hypothetical protein